MDTKIQSVIITSKLVNNHSFLRIVNQLIKIRFCVCVPFSVLCILAMQETGMEIRVIELQKWTVVTAH